MFNNEGGAKLICKKGEGLIRSLNTCLISQLSFKNPHFNFDTRRKKLISSYSSFFKREVLVAQVSQRCLTGQSRNKKICVKQKKTKDSENAGGPKTSSLVYSNESTNFSTFFIALE